MNVLRNEMSVLCNEMNVLRVSEMSVLTES